MEIISKKTKELILSKKTKKVLSVFLLSYIIIFQPYSIDLTSSLNIENQIKEPEELTLSYNTVSASCTNQCSYSGQKRCSDSNHYQICGNYDSDSCLEWSSSYYCGSGKVCSNGQCITSCSDECSYAGKKECSDSTHYRICGNYDSDSCLEWSSNYYCGSGKVCSNGSCVTQCTSHNYKSCYNNDLYWYDSCSQREEKAQECGSSYCGSWSSNYCESNNVYKKRTCYNKGCSNNSCYSNSYTDKQLVEQCGTSETCSNGQCVPSCINECFYSGQRRCSSSYYYQICGNFDFDSCLEWSSSYYCGSGKVCSNGKCTDQCTSYSYKSCYNNDLYWYDSCNQREEKAQECGQSTWLGDYKCSGNYLQRKWVDKGCSFNSCYANYQWKNYQYCGTDSWTNNYKCSGNWVQREKHKKGCSNEECYDYEQWVNYEDCLAQGKICQNGSCVTQCTSHDYKSCYNNDLYWYDSCSNREEKVEECGSNSYSSWQYYCSNENLYKKRTYYQRGCSNNACYENTSQQTQFVEDCGEDYCGSWGLNYCFNNDVYRSRTCYEKGCSGGSCTQSSYDDSQLVDDCGPNEVCSNGQCVPSCQNECSYSGQKRCSDSNHYQVCGNFDSDSCLEWSSSYYCGSGKVCSNGQCITSCNDECSYAGNKECSGFAHYHICGEYDSDSCLEWSPNYYCSGNTYCGYGKCDSDQRPEWYCSNGECTYRCNYDSDCDYEPYDPHSYKACYNNDVYWYDSDGSRQDKYRECGSDYCHSWGNEYCIGNAVYEKRTCYDKGCSNDSCYSDSYKDTRKVETCDQDEECSNGECISICECSSGPCCDGCNYEDSSEICDTEIDIQYGCPWGASCGDDVGRRSRVKYHYCSGSSAKCTGSWSDWSSWSSWTKEDYCSFWEVCKVGRKFCYYQSSCKKPVYYRHAYKSCYNDDLYWYDSNGLRKELYRDCDDDNSCTIDSCSNNHCLNQLKCDGSTCSISSPDYCSSCDSCGDEVCNCNENPCACREDCGFSAVLITQKVRSDRDWKKFISVNSDQELEFKINIKAAGVNPLNDISIKTELPEALVYENDLSIDESPSPKDITQGLVIEHLDFNESKDITFKASIDENKLETGKNSLVVSTDANYNQNTSSDSIQIEVIKERRRALSLLAAFLRFTWLESWKFWITFLIILIIATLIWFFRHFIFRKE